MLLAVDRAAPGTATAALELQLQPGRRPIDAVLTALLNELSVLPGRPHPGARRLPPRRGRRTSGPGWRSSSTTCRRRCTSSSARAPTPRCPSRGCGPAVSWSRSGPPTCASPASEAATYLNELNALGLVARRRGRPGDAAPRGGRPRCSWRPCPCRARRPVAVHRRVRRRRPVRRRLPRRRGARPAAGRRAPVPARHLGARPADRAAVRRGHRAGRAGRAMLEALERQNLFVVPLDGHRAGTGTTTCSPTCCAPTCSTSGPATCAGCTAAPATGTTGRAMPRRRCGTRSPRATSTWRPTWSSWPSRRCCASGARRSSAAGSTCCPPTWCSDRPVLAVGFIGALAASNEFDGRSTGGWPTSSGCWPGRADDLVVVDHARALARLPGAVQTYRAALALVGGDLAGTVRARRARPRPRRRRRPPDHRLGLRPGRASRPGPTGDLAAAHAPTGSPPRACSAPGTSPTCSAAPSPSPTSS